MLNLINKASLVLDSKQESKLISNISNGKDIDKLNSAAKNAMHHKLDWEARKSEAIFKGMFSEESVVARKRLLGSENYNVSKKILDSFAKILSISSDTNTITQTNGGNTKDNKGNGQGVGNNKGNGQGVGNNKNTNTVTIGITDEYITELKSQFANLENYYKNIVDNSYLQLSKDTQVSTIKSNMNDLSAILNNVDNSKEVTNKIFNSVYSIVESNQDALTKIDYKSANIEFKADLFYFKNQRFENQSESIISTDMEQASIDLAKARSTYTVNKELFSKYFEMEKEYKTGLLSMLIK